VAARNFTLGHKNVAFARAIRFSPCKQKSGQQNRKKIVHQHPFSFTSHSVAGARQQNALKRTQEKGSLWVCSANSPRFEVAEIG
jgi:hypothetical protein